MKSGKLVIYCITQDGSCDALHHLLKKGKREGSHKIPFSISSCLTIVEKGSPFFSQ